MLEREKDETHTFRQVDMCKWQMDDPETQMKFSLSDCTWLEDLSMEQFFKVTWKINEAKKSFSFLPSFFNFSLSFFFSFFLLLRTFDNIEYLPSHPPMLERMLVLEYEQWENQLARVSISNSPSSSQNLLNLRGALSPKTFLYMVPLILLIPSK